MFVRFIILTALFIFTSSHSVLAQQSLKVPSCFSDHMVLQQQKPIKVWGWTEPEALVNVNFHGVSINAAANDDGAWHVILPEMQADATATPMAIKSGDQELVINDVLIGEVWFASGQSNMAWTLNKTDNWEQEVASANHPAFRMYLAEPTPAKEPQNDIQGSWNVCTPENSPVFSATAYYFAKKIHQETGVPVGIIRSVIGGKRCECYCSREAMLSNEHGQQMLAELDAQTLAFDPEQAKAKFEKALAAWTEKTEELRKTNRDLPADQRKPLPRKPQKQTDPMLNPANPTVLYNGMIHPFVGYTLRGAIWYQGESNCRPDLAPIYKEMFTLMIEDWRTRWQDDFPFYFVQLANFRTPTTDPGVDNEWPTVQDQQRLTLQFPNTGMAVINDIGEENNIHPKNKQDVGDRLARWALRNQYGMDVVVSGPLFRAADFKDGQAIIEFDYVAGGLNSRDGEPLKRFEIAGEDKVWHWADAEIKGHTVVVSSENVAKPVAVRYAWASNPSGANLVNSEGLPASVFRTDDWPASFGK